MGYLDEFQKLHISIRTVAISILVLVPFWYLNIVVFDINSVFINSIEVPIIFAFCISSVHLFISYLLVFFWQNWFFKNAFAKMQGEPTYMLVITTTVSIITTSFISYLFYTFNGRLYWLVSSIFFGESLVAFIFFMKCVKRGDFSKSKPETE